MKNLKKKFENFWYYYKWHTVLAVFIIAVLIVGTAQCSTKRENDYLIMLGFKRYVPEKVINSMCDYIEKYGEDINEDGEVIVQIMDVSTYSGQDSELFKAASSKMEAESFRNEIMLYIVDDGFYDEMNNKVVIFDTYDKFDDKDSTAYNLNDTEFAEYVNSNYNSPFITTNTYFTKRKINKDNAKSVQNMKNAEKLLDNLIAHLNE